VSETPPTAGALTLEEKRRLEGICARFEAAWKGGAPPSIEDHLPPPPEPCPAAFVR
jgi:hypothetical protein